MTSVTNRRLSLLAFAALPLLASLVTHAAPGIPSDGLKPDPAVLLEGWEYRWGDSPRSGTGPPRWAIETENSDGWTITSDTSNLPGREGRTHLWLRTNLPQWKGGAPCLWMHSADLNFEMYLDGELHYRFGEIDARGRGAFIGWPWHLIRLPEDHEGVFVAFRIWSDAPDIGIIGGVRLGSEAQHVKAILLRDLDRLIMALLLFFVAAFFLLVAAHPEDRGATVTFSLFALLIGVYTVTETEAKQLVLNAPMLWIYLDLGSLFVGPAFLAAFIGNTYGASYRRAMQLTAWAFLLYASVSLFLSAIGAISIADTIYPFNILELTAMAVILAFTIRAGVLGNPDARIFTFGVLVLAAFSIYDIVRAWTVWSSPIAHWGLLCLVLSLAWILRRRLIGVHTQSIVDGLTGLFNRAHFDTLMEQEWRRARRDSRPLGLIMVDIDFFKNYNDTYGHPQGDECLKTVATSMCLMTRRAGDVVARYGGEEFAVLLPNMNEKGARQIAERMRIAVAALEMEHSRSAVAGHVTISAGAAAMVPIPDRSWGELLELADKGLYLAKHDGRNRVCVAPPAAGSLPSPPSGSRPQAQLSSSGSGPHREPSAGSGPHRAPEAPPPLPVDEDD